MQVSRNTSVLINYFINELLPPRIRDSPSVMYSLFRVALGDKARIFLKFREREFSMTDNEYQQGYVEDLQAKKAG